MAHFVAKWVVRYNRKVYAVFSYDKGLKLQKESAQSKEDNLKDILKENICIFDPRYTTFKEVNICNLVGKYEADLFLNQLFKIHYKSDYTIEIEGLDWSSDLKKPEQGVYY